MSLPLMLSPPSTPEIAEKIVCRICRRQFSKYTCPTCNIAYCSLTCFRSESHSQCSETFYRKEIESDIRAEPSKSVQERQKMIELLRRFEEQISGDEVTSLSVECEDEADDHTDLARRLKGVDLDLSSPDALWLMLTAAERNKFLKALDNPSSELTQHLLADEKLELIRQEPWWEAPSLQDLSQPTKKFGVKPRNMPIPSKMIKNFPTSPCLVYNIVAVGIAYAYATRSLSVSPFSSLTTTDPDHGEARRIISQLVPFLVDRKAKTLYPTLSAVVTDIWSRFHPGEMTAQLFSLLLRDTAHLLRPSQVVVLPPDTPSDLSSAPPSALLDESFLNSHPSASTILVLSDLSILFENIHHKQDGIDKNTDVHNHITLKLTFYCAHVLSTPVAVLSALADEIVTRSRTVENETVPHVGSGEMDLVETLTRHRSSTVRCGKTRSLIEDNPA